MKISIVIPARNEEALIGGCLDSIRTAMQGCPADFEIVVVLNRCTDATEEIAHSFGARTVREDAKNLAKIRNAGIRASTGDAVVTIDADSRMSPNLLSEIHGALQSGRFVAGGVEIRPERYSVGIAATMLFVYFLLTLPFGISAGCFWFLRRDFDAVGGFDESVLMGEDIAFGRRMKAHGRLTGRRFGTILRTSWIRTSCRKFDKLGDWYMIRIFLNPVLIWQALRGGGHAKADEVFYEFERPRGIPPPGATTQPPGS